MEKPDMIPTPVIMAIRRKFSEDSKLGNQIIRDLQWDSIMDCYWFTYAGMFHGVELDGYIHT